MCSHRFLESSSFTWKPSFTRRRSATLRCPEHTASWNSFSPSYCCWYTIVLHLLQNKVSLSKGVFGSLKQKSFLRVEHIAVTTLLSAQHTFNHWPPTNQSQAPPLSQLRGSGFNSQTEAFSYGMPLLSNIGKQKRARSSSGVTDGSCSKSCSLRTCTISVAVFLSFIISISCKVSIDPTKLVDSCLSTQYLAWCFFGMEGRNYSL